MSCFIQKKSTNERKTGLERKTIVWFGNRLKISLKYLNSKLANVGNLERRLRIKKITIVSKNMVMYTVYVNVITQRE